MLDLLVTALILLVTLAIGSLTGNLERVVEISSFLFLTFLFASRVLDIVQSMIIYSLLKKPKNNNNNEN